MRDVILGGGMVGLIVSLYVPDSLVVTDSLYGIVKASGYPMMLHKKGDGFTQQSFLKRAGVKYKTKLCRFAYFNEGIITNPNLALQKAYYMRSRKVENGQGFPVDGYIPHEFEYYAFDMQELLIGLADGLKQSERLAIGRVRTIVPDLDADWGGRVETVDKAHFFEHLYSTIPMPVYAGIVGRPSEVYKYAPKTFIVRDEPKIYFNPKVYDYIYVISAEHLTEDVQSRSNLIRITKLQDGGYLHEYSGEYHGPEDGYRLSNAYILRPLLGELPRIYCQDVTPMGRYAEWNDSLLLADIVERLERGGGL